MARRGAVAQGFSLPAPVGGWNARDSWELMGPTDAIILDNMFPYPAYCAVRRGSAQHATGVGNAQVEALDEWAGPAGRRMIAAGGGAIYDASSAGPAVSLGTGFSSNRWQSALYKHRLFFANGSDAMQVYDGSTLAPAGFTGVSLSLIVAGCVYRERMFWVERDSASFWYGGTGSIAGALTKYDLTEVLQYGGALMAVATWTRDGGSGPDDLFCAIMDTGEVVLFSGGDPGDINNWTRIGNFMLGRPLGRRCWCKYGSDLLIATEYGIMELSKVLPYGLSRPGLALTDKIQTAFQEAARGAFDAFGWQIRMHPRGGFLLVNYPVDGSSTAFRQFVMNVQTGAWCRFKGFVSNCWTVFDGDLYFGNNAGAVIQGDTGEDDQGRAIAWEGLTSFQYLGGRGRQKQVTLVRPLIAANAQTDYEVATPVDYRLQQNQYTPAATATGSAAWDDAEWDSSAWADAPIVDVYGWEGGTQVGYAIAVRLRGQAQSVTAQWFSTDLHAMVGGPL